MLGQEDVIAKREHTTSVICKSSNGAVFVCNSEAFYHLMSKDDKAWKILQGICL